MTRHSLSPALIGGSVFVIEPSLVIGQVTLTRMVGGAKGQVTIPRATGQVTTHRAIGQVTTH